MAEIPAGRINVLLVTITNTGRSGSMGLRRIKEFEDLKKKERKLQLAFDIYVKKSSKNPK